MEPYPKDEIEAVPVPTKFCHNCGRGIYPGGKWCWVTERWKKSDGEWKISKLMVCPECKQDGASF